MGRRASFLLFATALHGFGASRPKLGDDEWMRKYRAFIKASNDFVIAINDDVFDRVKWERLKAAWR